MGSNVPGEDTGHTPLLPGSTGGSWLEALYGAQVGQHFGEALMRTLSEAIYTDIGPETRGLFNHVAGIEKSYYMDHWLTENPPNPQQFIGHLSCLVGYLERTEGPLPLEEFLELVRGQPGWVPRHDEVRQ